MNSLSERNKDISNLVRLLNNELVMKKVEIY